MTDGNDKDKDKAQRRVYVLPSELVTRIVAFQHEMGLPSEVEAARRLLDDALKRRDDARDIVQRFKYKLEDTKILSDIARDVLIGHPLISSIHLSDKHISFKMTDGVDVTIHSDGHYTIEARGKILYSDFDDECPF